MATPSRTRRARCASRSRRGKTPSISPDGRQMVYLSDHGGHGNLWIAAIDGSTAHQITFERDPSVSIGVPLWSPVGDYIAFVVGREHGNEIQLIQPDGRGLWRLVEQGIGACWSRDGRWLYFEPSSDLGHRRIEKIPVAGGPADVILLDD